MTVEARLSTETLSNCFSANTNSFLISTTFSVHVVPAFFLHKVSEVSLCQIFEIYILADLKEERCKSVDAGKLKLGDLLAGSMSTKASNESDVSCAFRRVLC